MNKPIIRAADLARGLVIKEFQPQIVALEYQIGTVAYLGKFKLFRNPDGLFVLCKLCGCPARQLYEHPTRIGPTCTDCCRKARLDDPDAQPSPKRGRKRAAA